MPKKRQKSRRKNARSRDDRQLPEDRASETMTVAWTVSVTGVLIADLIVVAANLFVRNVPAAETARVFEGVMLLSAAAIGTISLGLLAVVLRVRQVKPPRGYMVFAALVAAAPIVALVGRLR